MAGSYLMGMDIAAGGEISGCLKYQTHHHQQPDVNCPIGRPGAGIYATLLAILYVKPALQPRDGAMRAGSIYVLHRRRGSSLFHSTMPKTRQVHMVGMQIRGRKTQNCAESGPFIDTESSSSACQYLNQRALKKGPRALLSFCIALTISYQTGGC